MTPVQLFDIFCRTSERHEDLIGKIQDQDVYDCLDVLLSSLLLLRTGMDPANQSESGSLGSITEVQVREQATVLGLIACRHLRSPENIQAKLDAANRLKEALDSVSPAAQ